MKNPFVYGQVVSGSHYLKRPLPEKFIRQAIEDNQNIFIVGERRCGKTSTVMHVIKSAVKKSYIHTDFYGVRTPGEVARRLITAISQYRIANYDIKDALKALTLFRVRAETKADGTGFEIRPYLKEEESKEDISSALKHIHQISKKKKLVVFFDEFQDTMKIKDSKVILGEMRSMIQFINQAPFIFTGSLRNQMDHIFRDPGSPFFKSALPFDFPKIEKERMFRFVSKKMGQKKILFSQESFNHLYEITNAIPGDIQQFCKIAFSYLDEGSCIEGQTFEELLNEVIKLEEKFYKYTLYESSLTKLQVDILTTFAKRPELGHQSAEFKEIVSNSNSNAINTAMKALEKHNLIYKDGKKIIFFNPFFREWLRTK